MTLDIREANLLNEALLSAYNKPSLEQMLFFKLGKDLDQFVAPGPFQAVIFQLIKTAEREGWTNDLVHAAHDHNPGNLLLKQFASNYLRFTGAAASLEQIIDQTNSFLDVNLWRTKLEQIEHQVCQIEVGGDPKGTGFLISHDLVMTNYHVIERLLGSSPTNTPDEVHIRFDFKKTADGTILNDGVVYELVQDKWLVDSSPYSPAEKNNDFDSLPAADQLDFAVLRIAPRIHPDGEGRTPGREPILGSRNKFRGWIEFPEGVPEFKTGDPLFIVQHPKRQPLKMALKTNSIISINSNRTRIRHRTSTENGSSGSGCYDQNWNLIALHHAGDPNNANPEWNQAVPVSTIRDYWKERGKLSLILGNASNGDASPAPGGNGDDFSPEDEVNEMLQ